MTLVRRFQDTDEEDEKPEGFWTELFLLKPDVARFERAIGKLDARQLLRIQVQYLSS